MSIAATLSAFLDSRSVDYAIVPHARTGSSMATAEAAHVPGARLAKAVMVWQGEEALMVVVRSDHHVHLGRLHRLLGTEVGLATEQDLARLFPDCDEGAIPPVGAAYGLRTLLDRALLEEPEVFFESGDHTSLVRVGGEQFRGLLSDAEQVDIAQPL